MSVAPSAFFTTWAVLTILGAISVLGFSGPVFYRYFAKPTYELWRYKINPKYPPPEKIRLEIIQTAKGMVAATSAPALSLYFSQHGYSQAYCGVGDMGWTYLIASFFVAWLAADLWEFSYHYCGHRFSSMWEVHKHHHVFFNPSPFAVIADEPLDQFVRALPMFVFPLVAPVNMDLLFCSFGFFFYAYGVYLHCGHDMEWPDAHHTWINTSYQHFAHHAISIKNKPYHTGFYIQLWDRLMGSVYPRDKCFCSKCARAKGEREFKAWEEVVKPDYSVLLSPSFWLRGSKASGEKEH